MKKFPNLSSTLIVALTIIVLCLLLISKWKLNDIEGTVIQKKVTHDTVIHYEEFTGTMPITIFKDKLDKKDFILVIYKDSDETYIYTDSITWSNTKLNDYIKVDNKKFFKNDFNNVNL